MRRLLTGTRTWLVLLVSIAVTAGLAVPPSRPAADVGAEPIRYAYDDAGRLVGVSDPAGDSAAYAYDEAGNLTGISRQPSAQVSVLSVVPSHGPAGSQVVVSGTGFAADAGDNDVTFGSAAATVTSVGPTRLVVIVPDGAATGPVGVATPAGSASSARPFTVEPAAAAPTITGFSPTSGGPGTVVTISGTGFDPDPVRNAVMFNQAARAQVTAATSTSLTVTVPTVGAGRLAVRTGAGTATSAEDFSVAPGGANLADVDSTTRLEIGGADATATVGTSGRIAVLRFDGKSGQRLSLAFTGKTIAGAVTVRLYVPVGTELSGNELSRPYSVLNSTSLALPPLPATGTYQLVVDPDETSTGSVVATLSQDLDAGTLDPAGPGTAVSITRVGQRARLALDGAAGQRYTVALSGNTVPSGTVALDVRWPDGEASLSGASFSGNRTVALDPLPETGRFQVVVDAGVTNRSFTITLSTPVDAGALSPTGPGVAISSARPGQDALLRFEGTAGQRLTLGFTDYSYSSTTAITILKPDGEPFTPSPLNVSKSSLTLALEVLPVTGTYELVLSPAAGSTGGATVTLSLELDGGILTTTGAGTDVTVGRPGQNMRLRFDGTAGQRLSLGFTGSWFTGSSAVTVLQGDGTALVPIEFLSGEDSLDLPDLPTTGTYELLVSPISARTGTATVTLSSEVDGGDVATTEPGTAVAIDRPGQNARLRFDGTAGQRPGLGFTGSTFGTSRFSGTYRVSVLQPGGTSLRVPAAPQRRRRRRRRADPPGDRDLRSADRPGGSADGFGDGHALGSCRRRFGDSYGRRLRGPDHPSRPGRGPALRRDAGQRLSLGWTDTTFGGSYFASVINPDGTTLLTPRLLTGTAADLDLPVLTVTGTYQVLVDPQAARTGSVTATLSSEADAGVVSVGGAGAVATFGRAGQNARLRFDGTLTQQLTLGLVGTSFPGFITVSVLKPDGTALVSNRNLAGTATLALAALPVAGTYEILTDPITGQTGSTTITLSPTPAAAAGQARPEAGTGTGQNPSRAPAARRAPGPDGAPPAGSVQGFVTPRTVVDAGQDREGDGWSPDAANLAGMDWWTRLPVPQDRKVSRPEAPPLRAPGGVTALAGQVQTLRGRPVAGVSVRAGAVTTRTDRTGRFLLSGLTAGHSELIVDGRTPVRPRSDYGTYEIGVDVVAGRTSVLPYPIWLTRIDHDHAIRFPSPTSGEVVVTTPRIPGLEVHLPAGSVVTDVNGKVVRELGITAIPVDRPPFPLPRNVIVPIYFTVQPGGAYVSGEGAQIIYPNYTKLAPRTRVEFWHYDPGKRGWYVYGHGSVTPDGEQVVPDPGVRVYELTGAMINVPGLNGPGTGPQFDFMDWLSGDPVELGTGLFVDTHTDLFLPDVMPISITRTYRQADGAIRPFGFGQNFDYGIFLQSAEQYQEADLVLPNGGKIHYERLSPGTGFADAVFSNTTSPSQWHHSTLSWNGNGWNLRRRDGMTYVFGDTTPLQAIRDRHGNQITLTRTGADGDAHKGPITTITSPNGKWIKLTGGGLVSQAEDSLGRTVRYGYDSRLRFDDRHRPRRQGHHLRLERGQPGRHHHRPPRYHLPRQRVRRERASPAADPPRGRRLRLRLHAQRRQGRLDPRHRPERPRPPGGVQRGWVPGERDGRRRNQQSAVDDNGPQPADEPGRSDHRPPRPGDGLRARRAREHHHRHRPRGH